MKKKILALALAITMTASLLGACGKEEEPVRPDREDRPDRPTTEAAVSEWPKINPKKLQNEVLAGDWETDTAVLSFDGEEYFWFEDLEGTSLEGHYQFDGMDLYLKDRKDVVYRGYMDRDGYLVLDEYGGSFVPSWQILDDALLGDWTYQGGEMSLSFRDDGTFQWNHRDVPGEGTYFYDGETLTIYQGDEETASGWLDEDNSLHLDCIDGWFYQEGGVRFIPLSQEDQALLEPKLEPGKMLHPMDNAVAFIQADQDVYIRGGAEWSVEQIVTYPEDEPDFKYITAMAACYVPYSSAPSLTGDVLTQCYYILYDKYTGQALPKVDALLSPDDGVQYEFESQDDRVKMAYWVETGSEGPYGGCQTIIMVSLNIIVPRWYDGLTIALLPVPESMEAMEEENGLSRTPYHSNVLKYPRQRMEDSLTVALG